MDVRYKRDYNHNYLVTKGCSENNYQSRILLENDIPGLLHVSSRVIDGEEEYYYEISSKQTLTRVYERREMQYQDIRQLLRSMADIYCVLQEYLLDAAFLLLTPEHIYINMETNCAELVFYPQKEVMEAQPLTQVAEFILNRVDHEDKRAVTLSYQFFKLCKEDNFVFHTIIRFMEDTEAASLSGNTSEIETEVVVSEEQMPEPTVTIIDDRQSPSMDLLHKTPRKTLIVAITILVISIIGKICFGYSSVIIAIAVAIVGIIGITYFLSGRQTKGTQTTNISKETMQYTYPVDITKQEPSVYEETLQEMDCGTVLFSAESVGSERRRLKPTNGTKCTEIDLYMLPVIIGKLEGSVDFVLEDASVSRLHARFFEEDGKVHLEDLNSLNGTFKNDFRLQAYETVMPEPGDEIKFGNSTFIYT